jgi:hypothetical protein
MTDLQVSGEWLHLTGSTTLPLPSHASVAVPVTCRPEALGPRTGELTLRIDTDPVRSIRVPLTCTGGGGRAFA